MRVIHSVLGCALIGAAVGGSLQLRFTYPHLTETELLLDFWPVWVTLSVFVLIGVCVIRAGQWNH